VVKIQSDDVLPVVSSLICRFGLFIVVLTLLGFGNHYQNRRRCNLVHKRCSSLEHLNLNVNTSSFLNKPSFLIKFGCLLPLLHLFADRSDVNNDIVIIDILSNTETSLDISHLDGSPRNTSVTLGVVLLVIDVQRIILFLALVEQSFFIEFLSFDSVALIFYLRGKFSANKLLFVWSDLLGQLEPLEPILQIHSHIKG